MVCHTKFGESIKNTFCFSYYRVEYLAVIDGTINANKFQKVSEHYFIPFIEGALHHLENENYFVSNFHFCFLCYKKCGSSENK